VFGIFGVGRKFFFLCGEEKNNAYEDCLSVLNIVHDESSSILGKWKLLKTIHPMSGQCSDYSQYNIVYEFKANNILTVSGEDDIFGIDEHTYSIIEPNEQNSFRTLKINNSYFWHRSSTKELMIDDSPLDGGIFYFTKIK
jgi:hypothetical protein